MPENAESICAPQKRPLGISEEDLLKAYDDTNAWTMAGAPDPIPQTVVFAFSKSANISMDKAERLMRRMQKEIQARTQPQSRQ